MGPSGAGKTTFMNALCGRCYYGTGKVYWGWDGVQVFAVDRSDLFKKTLATGIGTMPRKMKMDAYPFYIHIYSL